MSRLRTPRPGMSYYDANRERLVTISADLLDIKAQIEERWPGAFDVFFDDLEEQWVIVEHCADGEDRLFGKADRLDQRLIDRIAISDQHSSHYVDVLEAVDKHNEQIERDRDREFADQIHEAGERLIHALKKDGIMNHDSISR